MGTLLHLRTLRMMPTPSISGRPRSSSRQSGQCEAMSASAVRPSRTVTVSYPAEASVLCRYRLIPISSSTIITLSQCFTAVFLLLLFGRQPQADPCAALRPIFGGHFSAMRLDNGITDG